MARILFTNPPTHYCCSLDDLLPLYYVLLLLRVGESVGKQGSGVDIINRVLLSAIVTGCGLCGCVVVGRKMAGHPSQHPEDDIMTRKDVILTRKDIFFMSNPPGQQGGDGRRIIHQLHYQYHRHLSRSRSEHDY